MSTAFEVRIISIVGFLGSGKPDCSDQVIDSFDSVRPVRQARIRRGNGRLPGTGELTATAVVHEAGGPAYIAAAVRLRRPISRKQRRLIMLVPPA
jgi:hypothetical protein